METNTLVSNFLFSALLVLLRLKDEHLADINVSFCILIYKKKQNNFVFLEIFLLMLMENTT